MNLTGSPDYAAKIVYVGDPGSGCSSNQYAQFNTAAVTGPTYGSVGLESGRFILGGCPDHTVDLAIARNIRLGGNRNAPVPSRRVQRVQHRRSSTIATDNVIYRSPTDQTIVNSQYLPDGSLDPARLHAEERRVRRRHRRAADAEHAAADSVRVLMARQP